MKNIRATISILAFAAASSFMTNAIAKDDCRPTKVPEIAPFVIGFEADKTGTELTPVIYRVKDGNIVEKLTAKSMGALKVTGARCGSKAIAVNRFFNHDLFYTIEIAPGVYMRIDIPH